MANINASVVRRNTDRMALPVHFPEGKVLLKDGAKGTPEEVAELVAFLAGDASGLIAGTEIWIDGGMSLFMG